MPSSILLKSPPILPELFRNRSYAPEYMDDLNFEGPVLRQTLREIDVINHWLGGNKVTLQGIERLLAQQHNNGTALHIADIGCGSGAMLRAIGQKLQKQNLPVQLHGIDANAGIVELARRQNEGVPGVCFQQQDVLSPAFRQQPFDIITCTLFCHHFDEETLVRLFKTFYEQSRMGFVINDLHRHPLAYYSISLLTGLFSRSYMVRHDARLSVRRGFRRKELAQLLQEAGIPREKYALHWRWAFRYQLVCYK